MNTVPPMRLFFRKIAVAASALSLIFFCSCERHHPDELPAEHAEAGAAEHDQAVENERQSGPAKGDEQLRATTALPATPTPTAAQFFPENTPH